MSHVHANIKNIGIAMQIAQANSKYHEIAMNTVHASIYYIGNRIHSVLPRTY